MIRTVRIACALLCLAACTPSQGSTPGATTTTRTASARDAARAAWPGTYDAVSMIEGRVRRGTITVTPHDTGYAMTMEGPPGHLLSSRIVGDSAYTVWLLAEADTLFAAMRLVGDSVHGRQRFGGQSIPFHGVRRR